jgi:hypothetical protein
MTRAKSFFAKSLVDSKDLSLTIATKNFLGGSGRIPLSARPLFSVGWIPS